MPDQPQQPAPIARWEWVLLGIAMIVGAALRVAFTNAAPGLWMDEAYNGLDALGVLHGDHLPVFFEANNGREPLMIYLQSITVGIGGHTAFALRFASTIVGVLTIPVVWLLARELRGPAIAAAALAAFVLMRWHIHFSGLAFRTILAPLFASLIFLFYIRFWKYRQTRDMVLCGLCLGAGAYTYLSIRIVPVVLVVAGVLCLLQSRKGQQPFPAKAHGLIVGLALLISLPLGVDYIRNPEHFGGRSSDISLFQREDGAALILKQARDVAMMPLFRGDHVGKHNLPGMPQFWQIFQDSTDVQTQRWELTNAVSRAQRSTAYDPHGTGVPVFGLVGGVLFYVGVGMLLWGLRRPDPVNVLLLAWLLLGALVSVLSFGAPNMLRMLIITPVVAIVLADAAWGITAPLGRMRRSFQLGGLAVLLVLYLTPEISRMLRWPSHPMVVVEFNQEFVVMGDFLRGQPDRLPVLLPFDAPPTLRFLAAEYRFNPENPGDRWWEFRTVAPFPPLEPHGVPVPGARVAEIIHPARIEMGVLVECQPADVPQAPSVGP